MRTAGGGRGDRTRGSLPAPPWQISAARRCRIVPATGVGGPRTTSRQWQAVSSRRRPHRSSLVGSRASQSPRNSATHPGLHASRPGRMYRGRNRRGCPPRMLAGQLLREVALHPGQELLMMRLWDSGPLRRTDLADEFDTDSAKHDPHRAAPRTGRLRTPRPRPDDRRATRVESTPASLVLRVDVPRGTWARSGRAPRIHSRPVLRRAGGPGSGKAHRVPRLRLWRSGRLAARTEQYRVRRNINHVVGEAVLSESPPERHLFRDVIEGAGLHQVLRSGERRLLCTYHEACTRPFERWLAGPSSRQGLGLGRACRPLKAPRVRSRGLVGRPTVRYPSLSRVRSGWCLGGGHRSAACLVGGSCLH